MERGHTQNFSHKRPWRRGQAPSTLGSSTLQGQEERLETQVVANSGGSQSVVVGPAASASSGNLLDMQFSGLHPELLTQRLRGRGPAICFPISVGDCHVPSCVWEPLFYSRQESWIRPTDACLLTSSDWNFLNWFPMFKNGPFKKKIHISGFSWRKKKNRKI